MGGGIVSGCGISTGCDRAGGGMRSGNEAASAAPDRSNPNSVAAPGGEPVPAPPVADAVARAEDGDLTHNTTADSERGSARNEARHGNKPHIRWFCINNEW